MLTRTEIHGFRALKDVDVPLRPLTVVIGQNDTGKSSFLHALNYLVSGNPSLSTPDIGHFDPDGIVSVAGWSDAIKYQLVFRGNSGGSSSGSPDGLSLITGRSTVFALPASGVRSECQGSGAASPPPLVADGNNLADVLDYFLRNDRPRFDRIEKAIAHHVPGVQRLNIPTTHDPRSRSINFVIDRGFTISAENTSAGVRLMLFFITLAHHPEPPKLILIEEPENGVHPRRLADIMTLLREVTEGKHGAPAQVVLSTHSPYLLDEVKTEVDQVLVFTRGADGTRHATAVDEERLKIFLDEFMLGEVWYNQGEEGLLARRG